MNQITTIYHLADLHISYMRMNEFYYAIDQVILSMHDRPLNQSLCVICGDIFDRNSDVKSIEMSAFYYMIHGIKQYMPIVMIAGNHDINTLDGLSHDKTSKYPDLVSPLASNMGCKDVIFYDRTGRYVYQNI